MLKEPCVCLCAVVTGQAGSGLLDSYNAERRAVAIANTNLSVANWREALKVPQALGLDPAAADMLHRAVTSTPASFLPAGMVDSLRAVVRVLAAQ